MPAALAPFPLSSLPADHLLRDLLAVSLTGVIYYTPLYELSGAGEIVDFTFVYLNPAAQRMMHMPEVPTVTHNQQWPHSIAHGTFAFHVDAFVSGEPREYNINYQADGYDNYYRLAARRSGDGLLVSFTDTADQPRSPVEQALRAAQAAEKAARADAEEQRMALGRAFEQAPVPIAILRGPQFVVELANPSLGALWGRPVAPLLGRPLFEALPDLAGQGLEELLETSLRTGQPLAFQERATVLARGEARLPALGYFNFTYQPLHDGEGHVTGLITVGIEVTEEVLARQQLAQTNLALEARAAERTQAALAAQAEVLATAQRLAQEREAFYQVFEQTPAVIALLRSPGHLFEYANPAYQQLFPGRQLVGLRLAEAVPELVEQGFKALLDRVYQTGETFFGAEMPFALAPAPGHPARLCYYNFTYQAFREAGEVAGISIFAYDVTQQVLARQARETERQRLHALFMQAPAGICILAGPELVFEFVNPALQHMLTSHQLLGRPIFEALPEMAENSVQELLREVYATGTTHKEQGLLISVARATDGVLENRYFTFVYQARRDEQQQVNGVLMFAFEVTGQVVARQKLEESREELKRFKFMADQARDAFILIREDGSFAYLNQRALEAWGYSEAEARQLRVTDVDVLYQPAEFRQLFSQAQHKTIPQLETRHRRKDGQEFPVEVGVVGLQLNEQPHLLAVARDVTVQKQATDALRESEARFRIMADAAPNQVWAVNPDSTVRYVNRAFLDFVGVSLEQYVRMGWSTFMHPDELVQAQQALEEAIGARTVYTLEHRMLRHDGEYRWLLAQGAPSFYANGDLYGYVGSAIDITELKQANEQLMRTNVDLDTFIYTASHDLKVPIANIEGLLHMLQNELPAPSQTSEVAYILHLMRDSVDRFTRTIEHLTDVSKLQKQHEQPVSQVALAAVIDDVRQDLMLMLQKTGGSLQVDVQATPTLTFSEKNLRSVVYNLLSNALKFSHPERAPQVRVRSWLEGPTAVLQVQDNGLGLDVAHNQEKLFGMFQRLHTHVEGSGVGLYMIKRIVENAGGRIEVQSEVGQGATFTVYFRR